MRRRSQTQRPSPIVEREQALVCQRRDELNREERVARRLLVNQFRQRRGALRFAVKGVRQQLAQIVAPERGEHDVLHGRTGLADRIELAHQRVRGTDLVVPIRADEQQVLQIGLGQQVFEQIECRRIQPLQVVEEERQRMLGSREDADEPPKHQLKTSLRFLRRQLGDRWLFTDDVLQFRDEIDDQLPVRLQRLTKRVTPFAQVVFVLAEERPDQALECLRQRGIRDVALVLVELARCKQAARRDERLVELVHDRRLADAGVSGDQHQLRPAARDDAIERGEQGVDLTRPARTASRGS